MHLLVLLASMCDHEISYRWHAEGGSCACPRSVQRAECQKGGQRLQDSSAQNKNNGDDGRWWVVDARWYVVSGRWFSDDSSAHAVALAKLSPIIVASGQPVCFLVLLLC